MKYYDDWIYWQFIKDNQQFKSLERWALHHIHQPQYLNNLATKLIHHHQDNSKPCNVLISSIWVDGTPQAIATARTKEIKCELADLLLILETNDKFGDLVTKTGLLIQAKNTYHPRKIDSSSSTKKERSLYEKMDRTKKITLISGFNKSSQEIGSYYFDDSEEEGLHDCSRFLLMPKLHNYHYDLFSITPFHITWPIHEKNNDMEYGYDIFDMFINMNNRLIGKEILLDHHSGWSRLVADLENKYKYIEMEGYNKQNRIYTSDINFMSVHDQQINSVNHQLPLLPIIKVNIQYIE